jgi:hypothetical protein
MSKPTESPENKTFRVEGWLALAFFFAALAIGLLAAIIIPRV